MENVNGRTRMYGKHQPATINVPVETHVTRHRAVKWCNDLHKRCGPTYTAPAEYHEDTAGFSGGVSITIEQGIDHTVHDLDHEGFARSSNLMIVACRYKGIHVTWGGCYLNCTDSFSEGNVETIKQLGCRNKEGTCLIVPGDYNNTPHQLNADGVLEALGLTITSPREMRSG